jgi:hypothetical protein
MILFLQFFNLYRSGKSIFTLPRITQQSIKLSKTYLDYLAPK